MVCLCVVCVCVCVWVGGGGRGDKDNDSSSPSLLQLWVSSNLGANWTLLAMNVTDGRYYWRVMNASIEDLTAVYFETAINSE